MNESGDMDNRQNGDLYHSIWYYQDAIMNLPNEKQDILDMGSGTALHFEELLYKKRKKLDILDCVDQFEPSILPKHIHQFYRRSVEETIDMQKKYDTVVCFEVMEHVDKTDVLMKNCYDNLKKDGLFMVAVPNLSSLYGRVELMLGLQPHVLEISNIKANFGTGWGGG